VVELDAIPQETKERIDQIGTASLVIGLPGLSGAAALRAAIPVVRSALAPMAAENFKAVIAHSDAAGFGDASNNGDILPEQENLRLLPFPLFPADRFRAPAQSSSDTYLSILAVSRKLGAKAAVVLADTEVESVEKLQRLAEPVLLRDFDLVTPAYAHDKFEGLINRGIVYPLTRALYGKRIRGQLGIDFGFSAGMAERCLQIPANAIAPLGSLQAWMIAEAVSAGFQVGEAQLGRRQVLKESGDLSSNLAQILGPIFIGMERTAPFWQKIRGSQPVPSFGNPFPVSEPASEVDASPMLASYQLGFRNLQEVWGLVLSPATMLELKKLTRAAVDQFRLPDELWVRIIYDFALAHRLRVMNRDHLLRSMTPLYLAWVASYALEVRMAEPAQADQRIEKLCMAYEAQKSYLQSRWRWPDRFNP
jgi:hypothetical protein